MATLDRSRPFGQVYGFVTDNSMYVQDGLRFGANDEEITDADYLAAKIVSVSSAEAQAQAAKPKTKTKIEADSLL